MNDRTDAELVALARAGDRNAFGHLIERHQRMALRVAQRVIGQGETARDLTQEAILQAYLSLDRLRNPGSFQSWLYGIVLNLCRSSLRQRGRTDYSLEAIMGGTRFEATRFIGLEPGPEERAEAKELHQLVLDSITALSPKNRAATLLFYYEQLSLHEIASVLEISVAAVKGRLHKSRTQLRDSLLLSYPDLVTETQRSKPMVKVTIADVMLQKRIDEEETDQPPTLYSIVLFDEEGRRVLPIWVGYREGEAIAFGLSDVQMPRPMTYDFIANLLDAVDATLEEVRIEALRGDTYFAIAKLRSGNTIREVDARPSDVMALAVRTDCPIYVADDVMDRAGLSVPQEMFEKQPLGKGVESLIKELEENMEAMAQTHQQARQSRPSQEEVEEMHKRFWENIFGTES